MGVLLSHVAAVLEMIHDDDDDDDVKGRLNFQTGDCILLYAIVPDRLYNEVESLRDESAPVYNFSCAVLPEKLV
jgi:hypothetical protein